MRGRWSRGDDDASDEVEICFWVVELHSRLLGVYLEAWACWSR